MPPTAAIHVPERRRPGSRMRERPALGVHLELVPSPPPLPLRIVPRGRLVRRLSDPSDASLVVLVAPAGYGKTTLLHEWAVTDPRPFGWVTLGAADDDVAQLLRSIAGCLHAVEPVDVAADAADLDEAQLLDALRASDAPFVVVLDEADRLQDPAALALVERIVRALPEGSLLAAAARVAPALHLGRLRSEGTLLELGRHDLQMTPRESTALLRRAGLRLGATELTELARHTEGWPSGLQLAAVALRDEEDPAAASAHFAGDDRVVADYLREEMFADRSAEELDFLVATAPLQTLSGPLCDAALERNGSGAMLRDLARGNLLLESLDAQETTFRHHPLMAELLRAELRATDPERERGVHRRASTWCEAHGQLDCAVDHALAAGDVERVGMLLWRMLPIDVAAAPDAPVARWLARLDEDDIATHPALAVTAAVSHLAAGRRDLAERWAAAIERMQSQARTPSRSLAIAAVMLRSAIARQGAERMGRDARKAYGMDAPDGRWRPMADLLSGVAHHLAGRRDLARVDLEEGARLGALTAPAVGAMSLTQLALMALESDDTDEAAQLATRARALVVDAGLEDAPSCALVFATAAFALSHHGEAPRARVDAQIARRLLTRLPSPTPWYEAQTRIALARTELRLSDSAAARALLAEAARALRFAEGMPVLHGWIDEAWDRADTFAAGPVGHATLTTAELRVLRFLPSHLSFREIADRLHVSANTVKSQAHAVYRKLDASSRSEAVAQAREIGLIDG